MIKLRMLRWWDYAGLSAGPRGVTRACKLGRVGRRPREREGTGGGQSEVMPALQVQEGAPGREVPPAGTGKRRETDPPLEPRGGMRPG